MEVIDENKIGQTLGKGIGGRPVNKRAKTVGLVALAVFLVWEVVTKGISAYLAEDSPEKALALRATEVTALLNLAEKALGELNLKKAEPVAASQANSSSPERDPEPREP